MKVYLFPLLGFALLASGFAQEGDKELLRQRIDILKYQNLGRLGISNLHMCDDVKGFGEYTPSEENKVVKNGTIQIYYEPENIFTSIGDDGTFGVSFVQELIFLTPDEKIEIFRKEDMVKVRRTTTSPLLDHYAFNSLTLTDIPVGAYKIKGILRDLLREDSEPFEWVLNFEVVEAE